MKCAYTADDPLLGQLQCGDDTHPGSRFCLIHEPRDPDFVTILENWTPIDTALRSIRSSNPLLELPTMSGGSGEGWSRYALLQRCPRAYYYRYILPNERTYIEEEQVQEKEQTARNVGSLFHAFTACYYHGKLINRADLHVWLRDELLKQFVDGYALAESWRIFIAYLTKYEDDYLIPLAIEHTVRDPLTGLTCRYDLLAKIVKPPIGLREGVYVIEHKSTSAMTEAAIDGWEIDGEILGELAFYDRAGLREQFGELQGVCVNIVSKTKDPKCERVFVHPKQLQLAAHVRDVEIWRDQAKLYSISRSWPRALNNCINRYGKCGYYEICRREPDLPTLRGKDEEA